MKKSLPLDFILSFCGERMPEKGEDSYCYSFCDRAGLLGVFDGCGGAGARKHAYYSGKTEAYMASRLCAGAFYDSFRMLFPCDKTADQIADKVFAPAVLDRLHRYAPPAQTNGVQIMGSMIRTLPTTAAAALVMQEDSDDLLVSAVWAGDSRVFVLDSRGLAQLSQDDTGIADPMENLYEDGILRNIFCKDRPVKLHCRTIRMRPPFAVLAATDGCFGYVSTPMEFEGMLLDSLYDSGSVAQWETELAARIAAVAGDDHTLCLAAFGFGGFSHLKQFFASRHKHLKQAYLEPICALAPDDRQSRVTLWAQYRSDYMKYLEETS